MRITPEEARRVTAAKEQLRAEGFNPVYVWFDEAGKKYEKHTHDTTTAHVIIGGSMKVTVGKTSHELGEGGRLDVPRETAHSAEIGPGGCRYVIGEK